LNRSFADSIGGRNHPLQQTGTMVFVSWGFTARSHRPRCSDVVVGEISDEANGETIRGPAGELASGAAGRVCLPAQEEDN
jgi:hypothetical protein